MQQEKKESGFKAFTNKHKDLWQLIKFTMISSIAGITEMLTFMLMSRFIFISLNAQPFVWFVFNYPGGDAGGLGEMLAFLVSAIIGNAISFIINRKATFNANNNLAFSIIAYCIMIAAILCAQAYFGPVVTNLLSSYMSDALSSFLSKTLMQFGTFIIVFLMNKFVIMRQVEKA